MRKPRLLLVQIDGLSSARLRREIAAGNMPAVAALSAGGKKVYTRTMSAPPSTPVFQSMLLWGRQYVVHGYAWFDRAAGRVRRMDVPEDIALVEEQLERGSRRRSLFSIARAASYFMSFLGGAVRAGFTVAGGLFPSAGFRTPVVVRGLVRATGDVPVEVGRGLADLAAHFRRRRSTLMEWDFLAMRILCSTYFEEIGTGNAVADMRQGAPLVYIDYIAYDEAAHRRGPDHPSSLGQLPRIDGRIARLCAEAARHGYHVMVLSDHGQAPSLPFRDVAGKSLAAVVYGACADAPGPGFEALVDELETQRMRSSRVRKWGKPFGLMTAAAAAARSRRAARRLIREQGVPAGELAVVTGGSVAHIYLGRAPGGLTCEEIEARFPRVLPAVLASPGVGLTVVRRSARGPLVYWRDEVVPLEDAAALHALPPFREVGEQALAAILRHVVISATSGDIVVFGAFARAGAVTFEPELGSHGGIHPEELDLFVIPADGISLPEGKVLNPAHLNELLRNWYDQSAA